MFIYLKNVIKNNKYYWKYRHFLEPYWASNYLNNKKQPMIQYYLELI